MHNSEKSEIVNRQSTIVNRDPRDLVLHPMARRMPELEESIYQKLVEDVRHFGFGPRRVVVDGSNQIILGAGLWRAAKALQLAAVPCQVSDQVGVAGMILSDLIHREHYTKSAIAYLAVPLMADALKEARERKLECLKLAPNHGSALSALPSRGEADNFLGTVKTAEDMAEHLGISRRLFFEAQQVHKAFEADKKKYPFIVKGGAEDGREVLLTLREYYEPRILRAAIGGEHEENRPMGLGAVLAGMAGDKATKGRARQDATQLELFETGALGFVGRFGYWSRLGPAEREQVMEKLEARLGMMDFETREEFGDWCVTLGKRILKGSKQNQ